MASFLTGKLARQKNGRFTKPSFTKKAKYLFGGRKRKFNECESEKLFANKRAHSENMATSVFQSTVVQLDRYDGDLLINEQDDLYFLLHNFGVPIIPFK